MTLRKREWMSGWEWWGVGGGEINKFKYIVINIWCFPIHGVETSSLTS